MIFKQIQLFQLPQAFELNLEIISDKLEAIRFEPCSPSMPIGMGWETLLDEDDAPLARGFNQSVIFCLKIEEKILPSTVVRQAVNDKIKEIEATHHRKVYSKEKQRLKDDMTDLLLPRAFSKLSRVYAIIDTQHNWLLLGTTNSKKIEHFLSMFKKTFALAIHPFTFKKASPILTNWLKHQDYPKAFHIEKHCIFQDPMQQTKMVRCQQQDLNANSMQTVLKEGFEVKQIALSWNDHIHFTLNQQLQIQGLRFEEDLANEHEQLEAETKQQQFDADFLILSQSLAGMINDILEIFAETVEQAQQQQKQEVTESA